MATSTESHEDLDRPAIAKAFAAAVNMTPAELKGWLATAESKSVGWTHDGDNESVGHHEGRRLVEIKGKKKADLTDDDYRHMRKVTGYVHRHMAQGGPAEGRHQSRWRYSLMNWGHDPDKANA